MQYIYIYIYILHKNSQKNGFPHFENLAFLQPTTVDKESNFCSG